MLDRNIRPDPRSRTISFKVTEKEEIAIKDEVKRRKLKSISEFLAICVFGNVGKKNESVANKR